MTNQIHVSAGIIIRPRDPVNFSLQPGRDLSSATSLSDLLREASSQFASARTGVRVKRGEPLELNLLPARTLSDASFFAFMLAWRIAKTFPCSGLYLRSSPEKRPVIVGDPAYLLPILGRAPIDGVPVLTDTHAVMRAVERALRDKFRRAYSTTPYKIFGALPPELEFAAALGHCAAVISSQTTIAVRHPSCSTAIVVADPNKGIGRILSPTEAPPSAQQAKGAPPRPPAEA